LVINLTINEKKTFKSFLFTYLFSSFIFLGIISLLYFSSESSKLEQINYLKIQSFSNEIDKKIVNSQMNNTNLNLNQIETNETMKYALFDKNKNLIFSQFDIKNIDFSNKYFKLNNSLFLVSDNTFGHRGVYYVIIKNKGFSNELIELKKEIILFLFISTILLSIMAFILSKIFLKPILEQRLKINDFIKNTTHELNTPISALILCSSASKITEKTKKQIEISSKKIFQIYNNLTHLYLKPNENNIKEINIKNVIESNSDFFVFLADTKQIKLTYKLNYFYYKIQENDLVLMTDNIISNAIKYSDRNSNIEVLFENKILKIIDNGFGIKKEELPYIFNQYHRSTNEVGGFGVGLAIVKNICEKYNIKVSVSSEENKGTTFSFHF